MGSEQNDGRLRDLVARLRSEVGKAEASGHPAGASLRAVVDQIERALHLGPAERQEQHAEQHRRLGDVIAQFEAGHPGTVAIARELMQLLGGAGI